MPVLAMSRSSDEFANPRSAMKMDIVKPIPPSRPTPNTWFIFSPLGNVAHPIFSVSQVKPAMPSGLPSTSPASTPSVIGCLEVLPEPGEIHRNPGVGQRKNWYHQIGHRQVQCVLQALRRRLHQPHAHRPYDVTRERKRLLWMMSAVSPMESCIMLCTFTEPGLINVSGSNLGRMGMTKATTIPAIVA